MAKKAVATFKTDNSGRAHSKCIKMVVKFIGFENHTA